VLVQGRFLSAWKAPSFFRPFLIVSAHGPTETCVCRRKISPAFARGRRSRSAGAAARHCFFDHFLPYKKKPIKKKHRRNKFDKLWDRLRIAPGTLDARASARDPDVLLQRDRRDARRDAAQRGTRGATERFWSKLLFTL
jgi:hypothetical protein